MNIFVDFDGVLNAYEDWTDGHISTKPVEYAKEGMQALKDAGHTLTIFSCRGNYLSTIEPMIEWLNKNKIPYDYVWDQCGKPMHAEIFIDDRAINFSGKWKNTINDVLNFRNWLECQ